MKVTLELYQLEELMVKCSKMGAAMFAVEHGLVKTKISKAEAYRRYSKWKIDRWISDGKLKQVKNAGKMLIDVRELEALSSVNDLLQKGIMQ